LSQFYVLQSSQAGVSCWPWAFNIMHSSNRISDQFSDTYIQAREARALAVSLESNTNDQEASKQWHLIADSLFEAVELFDKMANRSNGR